MTTPHRPPFEDFLRWADQAPCVPVYRQVTGDALTPVSAFRKVERSAPSFLFEIARQVLSRRLGFVARRREDRLDPAPDRPPHGRGVTDEDQ